MDSNRQIDLFSSGAPEGVRPAGRGPVPVDVGPDIADLARRLPGDLRLGTSSWSFPGWAGIVYDGRFTTSELARRGLRAYASHPLFRTVGLDRTFYRAMSAAAYRRYADQVPSDFRFLVKAPRDLTTPPGRSPAQSRWSRPDGPFLDTAVARNEFIGPLAEGLGDRVGVVLFQFPPLDLAPLGGAAGFVRRIERFLDTVECPFPVAVEVRNRELPTSGYAEALRRCRAVHCFNVHPAAVPLPRQLAIVAAAACRPLVVRWMLRTDRAYEEARRRYVPFDRVVDDDEDGRAVIGEACLAALGAGRPAYVIANNKAEGSAPLTLIGLARWIDARAGSGAQPGQGDVAGDS